MRFPSDRLAALLLGRARAIGRSLSSRDGFVVLDGVAGGEFCAAAREAVGAVPQESLRPNRTLLLRPGATEADAFEKRNIREAEVSLDADVQQSSPLLAALAADTTLVTMLGVVAPALGPLGGQQGIKAQLSSGGGACFPMHHDAAGDARRVTAIHYISERWEPGWGGELKLYPLLATPVVVEPKPDRLVLFRAGDLLHRVLPYCGGVTRVCYTNWLSAPAHRAARDAELEREEKRRPDEGLEALLESPTLRRHLARALHADEWAASLEEAHAPSERCDALIANHWQEVTKIRNALRLDARADGTTLRALQEVAAREPIVATPLG